MVQGAAPGPGAGNSAWRFGDIGRVPVHLCGPKKIGTKRHTIAASRADEVRLQRTMICYFPSSRACLRGTTPSNRTAPTPRAVRQ